MKIVNLILRLIVGGVFVFAGVIKTGLVEIESTTTGKGWMAAHGQVSPVPDVSAFAKDVSNYRVPPHALNNLVAITLPWIEVVAGGLLIFGIWRRPSALVITFLLVIFLAAISQALIRGLNINCGCFGTVEGRKVGLLALAQDVALLAAAAWLWWREDA